jgi:capsid protein
MYGGPGQGYQGADWSNARGYVYFPQLDTRREITPYTRTEAMRRARFLYANVGLVRRLVNGMARMVVGTGLSAHATTADKPWNKLAEARFHDRVVSRAVFDIGGRFNFYGSQTALKRWQFRDGDAAGALTSSAAGLGRVGFYEAHQIGNGKIAIGEEKSWFDGVKADAFNRATLYRVLGDDGVQIDIPSEDMIFFVNYERQQHRGITLLHHAINNLLDAGEIVSFIKTGVKNANVMGYALESDAAATPGGGMEGAFNGGRRQVLQLDGNNKVTLEQVYGAGTVPDLPPGKKIRLLQDQRPHPNQISLLDYLVRDIAWGAGLSPEIIWNISALGGANTRFILADAQGWIEEQQQELIDLYCARVYIYFIAKELKAGRLRKCQDPAWFKHAWLPPPRLTVDFGRDGKLHAEQLRTGALTFKRFHGWQGLDSEEQSNQWLDEMKFFSDGAKLRGLDPALVIQTVYGRPGNGAAGSAAGAGGDNAADAGEGVDAGESPAGSGAAAA